MSLVIDQMLELKRVIPWRKVRFEDGLLQKYIEHIDWRRISCNKNVFSFLEKNLDRVNWYFIAENKAISKDFVTKHIRQISPFAIASNKSLSFDFLLNTIGIEPLLLALRTDIPDYFIEKYYHRLTLFTLTRNPHISPKLLKSSDLQNYNNFLDILYWNLHLDSFLEFLRRPLDDREKEAICFNDNPPLEFLEQHPENIDWYALCRNNNVSLDFFKRHLDSVDWRELSLCIDLTEEFIEEHCDEVVWSCLAMHQRLSTKFWEKHLDKIDWDNLCFNDSIPVWFFVKYIDNIEILSDLLGNDNIPINFFIKRKDHFNLEKETSINTFERSFYLSDIIERKQILMIDF